LACCGYDDAQASRTATASRCHSLAVRRCVKTCTSGAMGMVAMTSSLMTALFGLQEDKA
jgi:hypothetical protein